MSHRLEPAVAYVALALGALGSCVDSNASPAAPLRIKIGVEGGALVVGNGELSITVPAGALREEVVIGVGTAVGEQLRGWIQAGTAFSFTPTDLEFAVPAQYVIPFDPRLVSPLIDSSEVRVTSRDATGQLRQLVPTLVDSATVWFDGDSLGTFWVSAPDVVAPVSLFPLNDADEYHFDSGMVLSVERTSAEPNLVGFNLRKMIFTRGEHQRGIYFDLSAGPLAKLGEFVGTQWQEIHQVPPVLIADRDAIGTHRPVTSTYDGHIPFGDPGIAYGGIATTTTSLLGHERVDTPAGVFETVRVSIEMDFANTWPEQGTRRILFWCAPGIGPVAIRFDDGPIERVESGTVRGRPVAGA